GFAQILKYDISQQNMALVEDNVDEILLAGKHLLDLVNDILDLAKIETGKYDIDIKPVYLTRSVDDVLNLLKVLANQKSITIVSDFEGCDEIKVMVDLRSLKQSLINIISNAIKYNHNEGKITITVKAQEDGYCKLSITDTGDGIAEDMLDTIFDPFERATNRTNIEGTGVGLAITKNLVEIMGGKIVVESALGEGSTFSLFFKLEYQ
ncbi:MAG: HAMP domain-containing histidine kinase, partial [Gammaproteobacteria bacterium]|nr:HAMP domain-containing histidine kinase [Gammaproteobacteria bacterium]